MDWGFVGHQFFGSVFCIVLREYALVFHEKKRSNIYSGKCYKDALRRSKQMLAMLKLFPFK